MDSMAVRGTRAYLGPILVAVALHALFMGVFLRNHRYEISSFVCAADADLKRPEMAAIKVSFDAGYDGSAYFRIAYHPWQRQKCEAVRHLRILYPVISWACAAGDPFALLWVMPALNLLAIAGLTWLGAAFAVRQGLTPWWGCLLPLAINATLPALRNLGDVVGTLTLGWFLVAWIQQRSSFLLGLLALLSLLAREHNLAVIGLVMLLGLRERRREDVLALLAAMLGWVGWVAVVWQLYGTWPFLPSQGNFTWPFGGMLECNLHRLHTWTWKFYFRSSMADGLILFQIGLSIAMLRWKVSPALKVAALISAIQAMLGGRYIYCDMWSLGRVFAPMTLALYLGCLQARILWPLPVLASFTSLAVYIGVLH